MLAPITPLRWPRTLSSSWRTRIANSFYNLDRAIASLGGAPPQETISSEVGRVKRGETAGHYKWETVAAKALAWWLDNCPRLWGANHTGKAIEHADKLDAVDDHDEQ